MERVETRSGIIEKVMERMGDRLTAGQSQALSYLRFEFQRLEREQLDDIWPRQVRKLLGGLVIGQHIHDPEVVDLYRQSNQPGCRRQPPRRYTPKPTEDNKPEY